MRAPDLAQPDWKTFRIVPSHFPPIDVFERVLDPEELELAFEIEALTHDRLRDEAGDISKVRPEDRISGPGSSPVMAAFTHTGRASRFTSGHYGVYYAGSSLRTAVRETVFHRERYLAAAREPSMELTMRVYIGYVSLALYDIRSAAFDALHQPSPGTYPHCQVIAAGWREEGANGLLYRSVRDPGGECIAAFRPRAVTIPRQGPHLRYVWDGEKQRIVSWFQVGQARCL